MDMASGVEIQSPGARSRSSLQRSRASLQSPRSSGPDQKAMLEASRSNLVAAYLGDTMRKSRLRRREKISASLPSVMDRKSPKRQISTRSGDQDSVQSTSLRRSSFLSQKEVIPELCFVDYDLEEDDLDNDIRPTSRRKSVNFLPEIPIQKDPCFNRMTSRRGSTLSFVSAENNDSTLEPRRSSQVRIVDNPGRASLSSRQRKISSRKNSVNISELENDLGAIHEGYPGYRSSSRLGSLGDYHRSTSLYPEESYSARNLQKNERKQELVAKFRRLAHFLTILFALWKSHAKQVKHFLETNIDLLDVQQPKDLLFDVTEYKADTQARVSQETKRILRMPPAERTEAECRYVQIALGNYPTIAEYPLRMTRLMAERAWYERYDAKRVIIRQGHPARCYYFILNGTVVVSQMERAEGISRTVCFLHRGEHFGELGLVSNAPRQATVVSKVPVELLVFRDIDYVDIFMSGGLKEHNSPFLSSLYYLRGWPTHLLPENPNLALLSFFKAGTTLVHDSSLSDWIYIVKSGSCKILKKLRKVKPNIKVHKPVDPEEDIRVPSPLPGDHLSTIETNLAKAEERRLQQSLYFRQHLLNDLDLGIELTPLEGSQLACQPTFAIEEVESANKGEGAEVEGEAVSTHRPDLVSQGSARDKLNYQLVMLQNPFITKAELPGHSSKDSTHIQADKQGVGGEEGRTHPAGPVEGRRGRRKRKQKKKGKNETGSTSQEVKKTISDQLNPKFLTSDRALTEADLNPVFVRVHTLTKGNVFGLSHLIHDDQPSLSLVSNGAECILINRKFYMEHVDKALMNTLRMEVSPYPSEEELQEFLQIFVDWQHNKERVFEEAITRLRTGKTNIHDRRTHQDNT